MAKIGIVIAQPEYARNYLQNSALLPLTKNHNVQLIIDSKIEEKEFNLNSFASVSPFDFGKNYKSSRVQFLFNVYMVRFRNESKSFQYRLTRTRPTLSVVFNQVKQVKRGYIASSLIKNVQKPLSNSDIRNRKIGLANKYFGFVEKYFKLVFKSIPLFLAGILNRYALYWCARLLGNRILFSCLTKLFDTRQVVSKEMVNLIQDLELEVLIIPSAAYESPTVDLINIGKLLHMPTVLLIDNWDNLSSKSILWTKPDFVLTWGPQSSRHAINIQKMKADCVFNLGSARFTDYFASSKGSFDYLPEKYALFCGTFLPFDEIQVLQILDNEIATHAEIYEGLKIIYRPHPAGVGLRKFKHHSFINVLLDPQYRKNESLGHKCENLSWDHLTLTHIPVLVSKADFLIGGMTSMLIEGSLFHKTYVGLVHHEHKNVTSPKTVYESYTHFDEVNSLPNFVPCNDLGDVGKLFRAAFQKNKKTNIEAIDFALSDFIVLDPSSFGLRLAKSVDKVLAMRSPS